MCLAKDPDKRWQSIADVRAALEHLGDAEVLQRQPMPSSRLAWIVAGIFALVVVAASALYLRSGNRPAPELRLDIATPPTTSPASLALSPDGRRIAYVATVDGISRLWVRALDSTSVQPIPGSEDALNPFWSPDGRSLGFVAALELKRVELAGGQPQVIASVAPFAQASWGADNAILFASGGLQLMRTAPTGHQSSPAAALASGQRVHRVPLLPAWRQRIPLSHKRVRACAMVGFSGRNATAPNRRCHTRNRFGCGVRGTGMADARAAEQSGGAAIRPRPRGFER